MQLSTAQINGLRFYDPEDEYVTSQPGVRTERALTLKGMLVWDREREALRLSSRGKRFVRDYVARTGNGPEDLKARFRF